MNVLRSGRAFCTGVAIALLAGCGASQAPAIAPSATQPVSTGMQHQNADAKAKNKVLYSFLGSPDGAEPISGLAFNRDNPNVPSDLGVTAQGGDSNNDGTMYGLTKGTKGSWTESVLYTFKGANYSDGSEPTGITCCVAAGSDYIFVTTVGGGTYGDGAVVGLTPTSSGVWTDTVLHSFGFPPDGASPYGAVTTDKAGNLYGTTSAGGTYGAGTVYRMQPSSGSGYSETVLYSFQSGTDGYAPYAGLIIDKKGALYGTTESGGSSGLGTVFKLTPSRSGYTESILYSFQGPPYDGAAPYGGLTAVGTLPLAPSWTVIGMTSSGGSHGAGMVYKLTRSGSSYKESVLWNFGSVSGDGAYPYGAPLVTKKGVIVGTTYGGGSGGSSGVGTLFTLTPSSGSGYKESVYSFTGANGAHPYAGPSIDKNGNIYVTTAAGGAKAKGTIICTASVKSLNKTCVS
jgi:uncharacterized repeat protein (TIGR03803 family)